ncbi:MAG TPA: sulfatase-like hydrolase/transferase [Pseudolabrys sp.]|nr:sulfatase-like hydrolase/transferase [Pseudolabrys sp.]
MRPNFLFIITDQHRADHLGCYGNAILKTPAIDGIARGGVCFDRFYVSSAICMPNRASLMTGRPPSLNGVRHNGIPLPLESVTFVELLRKAGYRTHLVGKSHLQNMTGKPAVGASSAGVAEARRHGNGGRYDQEIAAKWRDDPAHDLDLPYYGFDGVDLAILHSDEVEGHYTRWLRARHPDPDSLRGPQNALSNEAADLPQAWRTRLPEELYPTTYVAEQTTARLREFAANAGRPFFLMSSFPDPHHPFTPPGRYWDMYRASDIPLPASWQIDRETSPPHVRHLLDERDNGTARKDTPALFACTEDEARRLTALTYGMIAMIDDAVGRILAVLEQSGLADNTVVVFTSDHGDLMGDHQLMLKGPVHYQGLIRVPFVWKDTADRRMTGRRSGLAATVDIARTVLDRAGVAPVNGMQGVSQLPVIDGSGAARDAVLIEEEGQRIYMGFPGRIRMRTLVTDSSRFSLFEGADWAELYDLQEDATEMQNLWGQPAARMMERDMLERLAREMIAATETSPLPMGLA